MKWICPRRWAAGCANGVLGIQGETNGAHQAPWVVMTLRHQSAWQLNGKLFDDWGHLGPICGINYSYWSPSVAFLAHKSWGSPHFKGTQSWEVKSVASVTGSVSVSERQLSVTHTAVRKLNDPNAIYIIDSCAWHLKMNAIKLSQDVPHHPSTGF